MYSLLFFFFSSRRRHTRSLCDWSSDVCSSDLEGVIDEPQRLRQARFHADVPSSSGGYITGTNCEQFGIALAILGGGREKKEDKIDHGVGLEFHKRIGDRVEKAEPLATIHYNNDARLAEAKA